MTNQREVLAQQSKGWNFGKCYNDAIKLYPNAHNATVTWCNCMMRAGPSFDYNMQASTNFCNRELASQIKAQQEANSQRLLQQTLPSIMRVPNYNQNSSGAIDALGRAFGLPSANSVTCRPVYGYDGYYQGTRCE